MNTNLNKIALDLYGKIQTRFPNIKIGDENAEVLSKKTDIPNARFFEFNYEENGKNLGTVAVTLDEDDGIVVQVSGNLADSNHTGAFKFIRSFRKFAKDRLLKFDVQNIGKDNLDKRDYQYKAKPKELEMEPMMESKMYGNARMSYQDLGENTRLVVKHSQPVNLELAAGRTMHIESIYVENADGERFKYPYKHLNGARALAEHLKHGGNPYDGIGKYITSLSEELSQLRMFKGYVGRNDALSEAMGDITSKVMERIEEVKKEVQHLQRPTYYAQFSESFAESESKEIPEAIMNDWIDRLTIRTFNEDLKTAFPYIFKLVGESDIPVKEVGPEDLLAEKAPKGWEGTVKAMKKHGDEIDNPWALAHWMKNKGYKSHKKESIQPEDQFESFLDNIIKEDEEENTLFSPNKEIQQQAIDKLNQLLSAELIAGPDAINARESLKGLIDDPEFMDSLDDINGDLDVRPLIQQYIQKEDPKVALQLRFNSTDEIGGEDVPPEAAAVPPAPEAPVAPPPEAAAGMPPEAAAGMPPGAMPPPEAAVPPAPVAESVNPRLIKALKNAKNAGATLDTELDFGHKTMTLHDAIKECGLSVEECGFDSDGHDGNPVHNMLKTIAGFWNSHDKNFTIGGTRAKTKIVKGFKEGEFPNASEQDVAHVLKLIDKMDPSGNEHNQIIRLAGLPQHNHTVDEEVVSNDVKSEFDKLMQAFKEKNPQITDMNKFLDQWQHDHPGATVNSTHTSSGTINGKPANYDDAVSFIKQHPIKFGDTTLDVSNPEAMRGQIQNMMKGAMSNAQVPDQNVQVPGGQLNPKDMMKDIMSKLNFN